MTNARKRIEALRNDVLRKWERFDAIPARPVAPDWFTACAALMFDADQRFRALYVELNDGGDRAAAQLLAPLIGETDQQNQNRLKHWLRTNTWPTLSQFGEATSKHAWMIALHADRDVPMQEAVLTQMTGLLGQQEVPGVHYASLYDRIAINRNRPQRFGMFYTIRDGTQMSYPVEAAETLAQRRLQLDLGIQQFRR